MSLTCALIHVIDETQIYALLTGCDEGEKAGHFDGGYCQCSI